jgi:hypothetical protein
MPEDIEALIAWQAHPDTNRAVFEMLVDDCMADAEFIAAMKVVTVIMREES